MLQNKNYEKHPVNHCSVFTAVHLSLTTYIFFFIRLHLNTSVITGNELPHFSYVAASPTHLISQPTTHHSDSALFI